MITTVTLNPALDLYSQLDEVCLGQLNRVKESSVIAAGKGINLSTVIKALDGDVQATGFLGEQNQQLFKAHFKSLALKEQFIPVAGENRQNIKLIDKQGAITEINYPGFQISKGQLKQLVQQLLTLPPNSLIVFAGSLPDGLSQLQFKELLLTLQQASYRLVIDCSEHSLKTAISISPDLIKPNLSELEGYFNCTLNNVKQIKQAVKKLMQQGVSEVLLSLGEQGVMWFNSTQFIKVTVPEVAVKNSVGAGDTLLAAYLWASEQGKTAFKNVESCLCFAAAMATAKVTTQQWQPSILTMAQQLLPEIKYQSECW